MTSEIAFAPLPVRRRGTLEVLDTALKLYRRYFGVLMGWSLLSSATWLVSSVVPFAYLLAFPLVYGSVACCVAAAVRGQKVTFGQVWDFTKPRYGAIVGLYLLSMLIMGGLFVAFAIAGGLIFLAGYYVLLNAPTGLQITVGIIAYIVALTLCSLAMMLATVWQSVVLFIVCLEDDKRGTAALGRAWQLMQGRWKSTFGLSTLLGLSVGVVFGIVAGLMALFGQVTNIFSSNASEGAVLGLMASMIGLIALFFLFWLPAQTMVSAVLYLDLRVRKEALDIEWSAYASAPPPAPGTAVPPTPGVAVAPLSASAPGVATSTPSSFGAAPPPSTPLLVTPPLVPPARSVEPEATPTPFAPGVAPPSVPLPTVATPSVTAYPIAPNPVSIPSAPQVTAPQVLAPPLMPQAPPAPPVISPAPPRPAVTSSFAPPPSANFNAEPAPLPFETALPTNTPFAPPEASSFGSEPFESSAPSPFVSSFGSSSFGSVPLPPTPLEASASSFGVPPTEVPPTPTIAPIDSASSSPSNSSPLP